VRPPPQYDPGLQPERTRLAWRRTLLTLAIGVLVALRFLPATLGGWSLGLGLLGWGVLWRLAGLRGRRAYVALVVVPGPLPGGALLLGLTVVAVGVAVFGLLGLIVSR
jgi:Domain of unknown function (DUF202)